MNETERKILRYIRNLRPIILQDGRLDIVETAWLVKAIHQDEDLLGDDFKAFVARLREVRADGVVTPQESESLVRMMDALLAQAAQLQAQAAQVQPVQALPVQQTNPLAGLITMADAKRIALTAAGVAEADARNFKVELDSEGVLMLYEVEFDSGFHEYEYKIDARTGAIVGTKKKLDIF